MQMNATRSRVDAALTRLPARTRAGKVRCGQRPVGPAHWRARFFLKPSPSAWARTHTLRKATPRPASSATGPRRVTSRSAIRARNPSAAAPCVAHVRRPSPARHVPSPAAAATISPHATVPRPAPAAIAAPSRPHQAAPSRPPGYPSKGVSSGRLASMPSLHRGSETQPAGLPRDSLKQHPALIGIVDAYSVGSLRPCA